MTQHVTSRQAERTAIAASALNVTKVGPHRGLTRRILVDGVSANLDQGRWTALVGRVGSGASELLRILAGRESVDAGLVFLDGRELSHLDPATRVEAYAGTVLIEAQLSPTALADAVTRALAAEPRMLFVDTVGGAAGAVSEAVLAELGRVSRELGLTVVLATDDAATALRADRALVMARGRIVEDL